MDLFPESGDNGELIKGWEYFRCVKGLLCERPAIKVFLTLSLINSVDAVVTELCRRLLSIDAVEAVDVPLSRLRGNWKAPYAPPACVPETSICCMSGGVGRFMSMPDVPWARSDLGDIVPLGPVIISAKCEPKSMLIGLFII